SDIPETVDDTTNELGQAHLPPEKEDAKSSAPTVIAPKKRDTPTTSKVETDTKDSIDELSGENEQLNEVLREIERELGERESDLQEVEREKEHEEVQDKVVDSKPTPQEQQTKTAVIRFLLDPELIDTDLTDVSNRLVRYVEDINKIYAKSTVRQFVFDPDQHVEIWDKPFPTGGMCNPLKPDYEYHVIIEKSQLNRSHGGNGGCNMFNNNAISSFGYKLENIWNSNDISNDDEARDDYYRRQLRSLIHELGHGHGLGLSEYYSIGNVTDDSGIEPYIDMKATDPNNKYWASRKDLFLDPMLGTAKLDTFMEDTLFTPLGSTIINKTANDTDLSLCPGATQHMTCSAFNVSSGEKVPIEVVDDQTKKPIPGCSLKIFKLNSSNSKKIELLESPEIGDQGSYVHTWIGIPHSSTNMARLVKAYCPGYQPGGEWISVFDLQAGKVMPNGGEEGDFHFDGVLTIELTPDVTTTTPTPETAPAPIVPPTPTVTPATTPTSTQISGAPSCGDGLCNGDETQKSCSKDCGSAITCLKGQEYGYNNYTKISNASDSFSGILMQGSNFGASITSIGDFDRDGITDFAVGAPGENDGGIRQGVVYLLFMKSDKTVRSFRKLSATKSNLETNFKTNNDARLGTSITNIGDLDGNGVTDLAIGAPGEYEHGQEKGAVYIVLLKADASVKKTHKISSIEDSTGNGLDEYDNFGYAISELGDLDGDGITDIAIGSRNDDDGVKDAGAVWILFLNSDGTVKSNKKISATQGNLNEELQTRSMFGSSISNLGDLNGNGIINIAVGERNFSEDGDTHGAFWIISLNPDGTVKTSQEISKNIGGFMGDISTSDGFGLRVANAGDIDGDGTNDVIASSLYKRDLWIILPNSDGTVKSQNIFIPPVKAGAKPRSFGESLSLVGDFDGNGKPEIIVGAPEDNAGNPADEGFLGESGAIYIFELDCTGEAITTCGDGNKEGKEQCDDGNNENGDGCSNNCKTEVERLAGTESCDDGICNGNETQEDCAKDCGSAFTCSADQPYNIESYQRVPALGNATLGIANSDMFGTSIVAMGDIDGDGVTDLAIGSDADKSLGGGVIHQAGAVFILFMNEDKTIKSHKKLPSREFITYNPMNSDHMLFGRSIANIGDIDDNGVSDLAIGETQHGFYMGKTVYGAVWIALLNNDGSVKSYKLITKDEGGFTGDLKNGGFGKDIAGLGDLDGDGINDIAVGQNGNNTVWILFMNSDGTIKSHNEISESTFDFANKDSNSLDSFGDSVVNIGDLDNDGIIDIAVGEPNNKTESGSNRKAFWILFLNTDGTVKDTYKITEELSKINDKPSGNNTIANIGDLNGDHISDLAIGSLREDQLQFSINLLLMNEDGTVKESQVISSTQGGFFADLNEHTHRFGSISALGDLDKDGRTEIAVGTPMESEDGGTNKGAVYILDLGCQGETKSPVKKTITSKSATKCGDGLCNGDETQKSCSKDCGPALACADQNIVVKNVKTINDFEGNLEDVLIVGGGFGHSMTPLGDMNGDGVTDLAIGGADTNNKENSIFILFMNANKTVKSYKTIKGTDFYYDDNQNAHQQFGNSIANIGDIDGNGVTDIAIGEKYYKRYTFMTWSGSKSKSEYAFTGAIWIALLNSDRTVKSYNLISDGEGGFEGYLTKDGMFGQSVTGLGDLDGDGINDVAVGEPGANATWILFLDNDGAVKDHIKISNQQLLDSGWKPAESDISPDLDDFGSSVSNIGDMDGDGVIDIAVGESMDQNQNNMGGALWILFMNNNGTVKNAVKTRSEDAGLIRNQYLNGGIASVGDLDSNGVSDLVVEALNENGFYILFMNSDGTVMSSKTFSKKNGGLKEDILLNKYSGESIGSLGDFDGDGNPDVLIGAPKDNHGGTGKGAIFFVNLSCFAECEDECTISDTTECLSKSEYGTCGDYDDDNCLEWGEKGTCDAGKECYGAGTCSNGPTAWCGDGICNEKETQDSCSRDCGAPAMCAKNIYGVIDYKEISVKDKEVFEDGQYITGFGSAIAHIGDVDKDGINDLAVAIEGSLEGYGIYILLMNEDGSIKSYKSILSDQYAYEQKEKVVDVAALGDFDGDQTPDIAIVSDTSGVTNP
ncbi:FG-GAP repeat protein, partial [Patescibacteria group bacterium]|nr:FG-GAP repeat protein [Patescibacteria group bacterium]